MRLLDLFCGRFGWSRAFAKRGWECIGVDLVEPPEIPEGCRFVRENILDLDAKSLQGFDFIVASSPCEQFSVHGMKHFHPNPPYPELGIKLFNHTRELCEASGVRYVMENVRAAQDFVGKAVHHCGPFYLWGTGVPPLIPRGISKGMKCGSGAAAKKARAEGRLTEYRIPYAEWNNRNKVEAAARVATIPIELANCVADYAERILEVKA